MYDFASMSDEEISEIIGQANRVLKERNELEHKKLENAFIKACGDLREAGCEIQITEEGLGSKNITIDKCSIIQFKW